MTDTSKVVGVLLAGGLARRMGGGDKCLQELVGKPLLAYSVDVAKTQVGPLIINAAGDPARFASFNLPVVADVIDGFAGPLAGVLTGMEWAKENQPETEWIVTFPTDAPFFPDDLVQRLMDEVESPGPKWPARVQTTGPIRSSPCGRSVWQQTCVAPWSKKTCARWMVGRRITTLPT